MSEFEEEVKKAEKELNEGLVPVANEFESNQDEFLGDIKMHALELHNASQKQTVNDGNDRDINRRRSEHARGVHKPRQFMTGSKRDQRHRNGNDQVTDHGKETEKPSSALE